MGKVWILLAVTVLVATVITAKNTRGVGKETTMKWPSSVGKEALTGSSNRSESIGKWTTPFQENKWHPRNPRVRLNSHSRLPERSQNGEKKMLGGRVPMSMSQELFNSQLSKKIRDKALSSMFITGMAKGNLPLDQYRDFLVQDAVYLQRVAKVYYNAQQAMLIQKNTVFANFYSGQHKKFLKLHEDLVAKKKVKELQENEVGEALQDYMWFLSQVDPHRLAIAMLPCSMLYRELAKTEVQNPNNNVYEKDWFQENRSNGESSTEKFVNTNFKVGEENYDPVFLGSLIRDVNLLLEICGEKKLRIEEL